MLLHAQVMTYFSFAILVCEINSCCETFKGPCYDFKYFWFPMRSAHDAFCATVPLTPCIFEHKISIM